MGVRSRAALGGLLVLVCLLGALVATWPVAASPGAVPLDPNTPLHVLVAHALAEGEPPGHVPDIGWPEGVDVVPVAWPVVGLAAILGQGLEPLPAWNAALVGWLALQGGGVAWLGGHLGWPWRARAGAALAAILAPPILAFTGNGQPENIALLPFVVAVAGALRGGWGGALLGGVGVLLAGLSSPYQALVAVLLAVGTIMVHPRELLRFGVTAGLALALVHRVYAPLVEGGRLLQPAMGSHEEGLALGSLVVPRAQGRDPARPVGERLARLGRGTRVDAVPPRFVEPIVTGYLGWTWLVLGAWGLARHRRTPWVRGLALGALAAGVLSLGCRLRWAADGPEGPWLPWAWLRVLDDGIAAMHAPYRLVTGPAFALVIGVGLALAGRQRFLALGAALAMVIEALTLAPVRWPLPVARSVAWPVEVRPDAGPLAVWPAPPLVPSERIEWLALRLGRPMAVFMQPVRERPGPESVGARSWRDGLEEGVRDGADEDLAAWVDQLRLAGVEQLLGLDGPELPEVLARSVGPGVCVGRLCLWSWVPAGGTSPDEEVPP